MIGYCRACAQALHVTLNQGDTDKGAPGTCAICTEVDTVYTEVHFGPGRHLLNGAALDAKLRRGKRIEPHNP